MLTRNFSPFSLMNRWSDRRARQGETHVEPQQVTGTVADLLGFDVNRQASILPGPPQKPHEKAEDLPSEVLKAWALQELAHWCFNPVSRSYTEKTFARLNEEDPNTFIYTFGSGEVRLAEKPQVAQVSNTSLARAKKYLVFFSNVAATLPVSFTTTIAMVVSDKVVFVPDVPVFCFQKRIGNNTVLAPDIDFLDFDFYESDHVTDTIDFKDKIKGAIFIGGTTGGDITLKVAQTCSLPRLRAARFFQDNSRVEFRLPQIVQTVGREPKELLESFAFCQGGRVSWKQQLQRQCLISIDGNGATCSRVVIALRSNSALLKYVSNEKLYYFSGLTPWVHYIPIIQDEDIDKSVDIDNWSPGTLQRIACEGRKFAEKFLTRAAVTTYMAELLQLYASCFTEASSTQSPVTSTDFHLRENHRIFLVGHIEEMGDTEANADGWVGAISTPRRLEGFLVSANVAQWRTKVQYQALQSDGTLSAPKPGGDFCGTKGKQLPIHGFVLHLAEDSGALEGILYEGIFGDGYRSGPQYPGLVCSSPTKAPLIAMRVFIRKQEQV